MRARQMVGSILFALPGTFTQRAVQRMIGGPRESVVTIHGRPFHCSTAQKYWWLGERLEADTRRMLEERLTPQSVFYDVGAHYGYWAVSLSGHCRKIVALEPSPANFRALSRNVAGLPNVTALNLAAAERGGVLRFSENGSMSRAGVGDTEVPAATLDAIADQHGTPDIVLIDVEGYAGHVLRGMARILDRHPVIVAEIHSAAEELAFAELPGTLHAGNRRRFPYHAVIE